MRIQTMHPKHTIVGLDQAMMQTGTQGVRPLVRNNIHYRHER